MNGHSKTPTAYLAALPEPRKSELKTLDKLIRKTAPMLKPYMQSGVLGYGKYHYTYASGREGDWSLIALASRKNYISLYSCIADGRQYVAEKYKKDLPKASIGKSCVRFKKLADVDLKVIEKMLREAVRVAKQMKVA